ncbi:unnamed protein product, partial [Ectocarpus sp. 6 AP-2014]
QDEGGSGFGVTGLPLSVDASIIGNRWASFLTRPCRFCSCNHTSRTQPTPLRFSREFACTTLITPRDGQKTSGSPPINPQSQILATSLLPLLLLSTQQTNSGISAQAVRIGNECLPAGYAGDGHARSAASSANTGISHTVGSISWVISTGGSNVVNLPRLSEVFSHLPAYPTSADAFYDSTTSSATNNRKSSLRPPSSDTTPLWRYSELCSNHGGAPSATNRLRCCSATRQNFSSFLHFTRWSSVVRGVFMLRARSGGTGSLTTSYHVTRRNCYISCPHLLW